MGRVPARVPAAAPGGPTPARRALPGLGARGGQLHRATPGQPAAAVSGVVEQFGDLDILVNNAGVVLSNRPVTEMPRAEWDAVIETNLTGTFLCVKHAPHAMVRGGRGGKIINIASIYACYGPPDFAHYPSAKAGCSD